MMQQTTTTHRDPVCGMGVDQATAAGRSTYAGQEYYFCSGGCKRKFDTNPEQYLGSSPTKKGGCCCG